MSQNRDIKQGTGLEVSWEPIFRIEMTRPYYLAFDVCGRDTLIYILDIFSCMDMPAFSIAYTGFDCQSRVDEPFILFVEDGGKASEVDSSATSHGEGQGRFA